MPLDLNTVLGASPANPMGAQGPATPPEASAQPGQPAPAGDEGSQDYAGEPGKGVNPAAALETLPADIVDIPVIYNVAKGSPPAVSAPDQSNDPAVQAIIKHAQDLVAAGFGLYESIDGKNWVLFNTQSISADDLHTADSQGKLLEVAPAFSSVKTSAPGQAAAGPAAGSPPAAPQAPAQQPESQPAPSVQQKLATSRTANLAPGSPTSGPAPGAGRLLNSILKPAV